MCPRKMYVKVVCQEFKCFLYNLFGQTVYYSASPSLNVLCDPGASLLLHFWDFIVAPKKLKLDFNISTAK